MLASLRASLGTVDLSYRQNRAENEESGPIRRPMTALFFRGSVPYCMPRVGA